MLALPSDPVHAQESNGVRALRLALSRCDEEKAGLQHLYGHGVCWLMAMGEADWEAEKHFIRKELEYANGSLRPLAPAQTDSKEPALQLRDV